MKKLIILGTITLICFSFKHFIEDPVPIPPSKQRVGNADAGYQYIITGDYVKSGLPLGLYGLMFKKENNDPLNRGGENAKVRFDFNVVKAYNDENIVVPNCLQCHADIFEGKLIV